MDVTKIVFTALTSMIIITMDPPKKSVPKIMENDLI